MDQKRINYMAKLNNHFAIQSAAPYFDGTWRHNYKLQKDLSDCAFIHEPPALNIITQKCEKWVSNLVHKFKSGSLLIFNVSILTWWKSSDCTAHIQCMNKTGENDQFHWQLR